MTLDLSAIAEAAMAATPGPWESRTELGHPGVRAIARPDAFDWICSMQVSNSPRFEANAAFIALANPTTVLALVDRIRELEAGLVSAAETIESWVQSETQHAIHQDDPDWKKAAALRQLADGTVPK
jgi:mannose/fructose/N-acetylgalactosamine-specific phosphotransferase system component IIB